MVATHMVERARAGDDAAFSELVGLTRDRCFAVAYPAFDEHAGTRGLHRLGTPGTVMSLKVAGW